MAGENDEMFSTVYFTKCDVLGASKRAVDKGCVVGRVQNI
jgi:hypothetical protein